MSSSKRCWSGLNTTHNKANKGLLLRFLSRVSGYSKVQIKRLVQQYLRTGKLHCKQRTAVPFTRKYTLADIRYWHKPMSGMKRSPDPPPRSCLSVLIPCLENAVMNDWRKSLLPTCTTCGTQSPMQGDVCIMRKHARSIIQSVNAVNPSPMDSQGISIDTVHQGDLNRQKGVYHINATDEVTQFEFVFTVEKISERYLLPILEALLDCFPFALITTTPIMVLNTSTSG